MPYQYQFGSLTSWVNKSERSGNGRRASIFSALRSSTGDHNHLMIWDGDRLAGFGEVTDIFLEMFNVYETYLRDRCVHTIDQGCDLPKWAEWTSDEAEEQKFLQRVHEKLGVPLCKKR